MYCNFNQTQATTDGLHLFILFCLQWHQLHYLRCIYSHLSPKRKHEITDNNNLNKLEQCQGYISALYACNVILIWFFSVIVVFSLKLVNCQKLCPIYIKIPMVKRHFTYFTYWWDLVPWLGLGYFVFPWPTYSSWRSTFLIGWAFFYLLSIIKKSIVLLSQPEMVLRVPASPFDWLVLEQSGVLFCLDGACCNPHKFTCWLESSSSVSYLRLTTV